MCAAMYFPLLVGLVRVGRARTHAGYGRADDASLNRPSGDGEAPVNVEALLLRRIPKRYLALVATRMSNSLALNRSRLARVHDLLGIGQPETIGQPATLSIYERAYFLLTEFHEKFSKGATWARLISTLVADGIELNSVADELRYIGVHADDEEEPCLRLPSDRRVRIGRLHLRLTTLLSTLCFYILGIISVILVAYMSGIWPGNCEHNNNPLAPPAAICAFHNTTNTTTAIFSPPPPPLPPNTLARHVPRNSDDLVTPETQEPTNEAVAPNPPPPPPPIATTTPVIMSQTAQFPLRKARSSGPSFLPDRTCDAHWDYIYELQTGVSWSSMREPRNCTDAPGLRYMLTTTGVSTGENIYEIMCKVMSVATSLSFMNLEITPTSTPDDYSYMSAVTTCSLREVCDSVSMLELVHLQLAKLTVFTSECVTEFLSYLDFPKLAEVDISDMDIIVSNVESFRVIFVQAANTLTRLRIGENVVSDLHPILALLTDEVCAKLQLSFRVEVVQEAWSSNAVRNIRSHPKCAGFLKIVYD